MSTSSTVDTLVIFFAEYKLNSDNCRSRLHKFKQQVYTAAKRELIQGTLLDNGLTISSFYDYGTLLSDEEWLFHQTTAFLQIGEDLPFGFDPTTRPAAPLFPQRLPVGATAAARDEYKFDLAEYNHFQQVNSIFLLAIQQSMDQNLLLQMEIDGSLMGVNAIHIFATLHGLYGIPRDEDYQQYISDYTFPFVSSLSISAEFMVAA